MPRDEGEERSMRPAESPVRKNAGTLPRIRVTALTGVNVSPLADLLKGARNEGLQFQSSIAPLLDTMERLRATFAPILELQKSIAASLAPVQAVAQAIKLPAVPQPPVHLNEVLESIRRSQSLFAGFPFGKLHEALQRLPERTRASVLSLARQGWFFDLEMPIADMLELEDLLAEGDVAAAEERLIEHFRSSLTRIEADLTRRYPARAKVISAARRAHEAREYVLSVPVLLVQADGLCYDTIGVQLFKRKNVEPATAEYARSAGLGVFHAAVLAPLAESLPISAPKHERGDGFDQLNRHEVLHGESVDYDTEVNSLRAWSLLNYVGTVLSPDSDADEGAGPRAPEGTSDRQGRENAGTSALPEGSRC